MSAPSASRPSRWSIPRAHHPTHCGSRPKARCLSFTGDTEWTESLVPAGHGADLYIMECYMFDGAPRVHTSWQAIARNLDRIAAKRVMITHMAEPMLARRHEVTDPRVVLAEDGLVLEV